METPPPSAEVYVLTGVVAVAVMVSVGCYLLRKWQQRHNLKESDIDRKCAPEKQTDAEKGVNVTDKWAQRFQPSSLPPRGTTLIHVVSYSYHEAIGPDQGRDAPSPSLTLFRQNSFTSEYYYSQSRPQTAVSRKAVKEEEETLSSEMTPVETCQVDGSHC